MNPSFAMMNRLVRSRAFATFWAVAGGVSIRIKVLGIVMGVILLLSLFVTVQMRSLLYETLHQELTQQGIALSLHITDQINNLLKSGVSEALDFTVQEQKTHYSNDSHNTQVAYIAVFDSLGKTRASTFANNAVPPDLLPKNLGVPGSSLHDHVTFLTIDGQSVLDIAGALPANEGVVRLGLKEDRIHETVNGVTLQLLSITLIMVVVGLLAAFFLTWILTRPILNLVDATQAVSQGDFTRHVHRWANDEIGELATAFNAMTESLAQADHERAEREALRAGFVSRVIVAQEEERKRIARELHDSTGQSLTSLLVGMQNLKDSHDSADAAHKIDALRETISQLIDEVRHMAWELRPSTLDDLGLLSAIEHYVAEYQERYSLPVDFVAHGLTERLPLEMETSIYRIVQEALTNIVRHARAHHASVIIDRRQDTIRIIIEDDGVGFQPEAVNNNRLGLQGIRERAALFQGTLTIESQSGQGTTLFVLFPYTQNLSEARS